MKKLRMSLGVAALVLALGVSFASFKPATKTSGFNWHRYSGSTSSPTVTTVIGESDADARAECPGVDFLCMVRLDGAGNETNIKYFRPEQP